MSELPQENKEKLEKLITDAMASGGSELANYGIFIDRLCTALDLPRPEFATDENHFNDYVLERRVDFKHPDGSRTAGRIDCYKRGCFVLEAKQSVKRGKKRPDADQLHLLPEDALQRKAGHARQGTKQWDQVMLAARRQAEEYARALPVEHGYPPFLLIADIGNVIEVYADFSGQGKNYAHFPDRRTYRIAMEDLRQEEIQKRLTAIWTDPHSLDPAKRSAEVTRDIAERLARIAKRLEGKHDPKDVAEFLMRCLFTMFAEDVDLIPKHSFEELLEGLKDKPDAFVPALEHLWKVMDEGGFEPRTNLVLKRFNGSLFKNRTALPLDPDGIHELQVAASRDWSDVEPAIFGTLLERALDPRERSKLGAHYTPRAYVERLVVPTIIEPMREEWETAQETAQELLKNGDQRGALRTAQAFHRTLCTTRVLDPACGTGNFLYVSLELMKKLEGEVLDAIAALGGQPSRYTDFPDQARVGAVGQRLARTGGRFTVDPHQFYGLEINPRAVAIADLVLWIGYIKNQINTSGVASIEQPILDAYGTIRHQDAILNYDRKELRRDEQGKPLSRWDGVTKKPHPITGEDIPDPDAAVELYNYTNPRIADWPEAEFIVGNPPFVSARELRSEFGDGYVEALGRAYPTVDKNVDFVVYFWFRALTEELRTTAIAFVATSRLRMQQNNKVFAAALAHAKRYVSFAIPDHKWPSEKGSAAVRICVANAVRKKPTNSRILITPDHDQTSGREIPDDLYWSKTSIKYVEYISSDLNTHEKLATVTTLESNSMLGSAGVKPYSQGFLAAPPSVDSELVKSYANGHVIGQNKQLRSIVDANSLSEVQLSELYPKTYQYLYNHVKPRRDYERNDRLRKFWWRYEANRDEMREAISNIGRYFVTLENSPRRYFVSLNNAILPDQKLRIVALDCWKFLAVLSSKPHEQWSVARGGRAGKANTPVYNSRCFDTFPFPATVTDDSDFALQQRLADLGERLDAFREERLAKHDFLTMTGLYNVLERVRELEWAGRGIKTEPPPSVAKVDGLASRAAPRPSDPATRGESGGVKPLTDAERDIYEAGLIAVLKEIHDEIDRAVFEAYGWQDLGEKLVGRSGATMPSPYKSEEQKAAEEELLSRLVALNLERQAEERRGLVRWLRPEYQIAKLGHKVKSGDEQVEADIAIAAVAAEKPKWPKEPFEQIRIVKDVLAKASAPASSAEVAATFSGGRNRAERVDEVLKLLAETGGARTGELEGETRYFVAR